jgi:RNA polymerase primary sigma factor
MNNLHQEPSYELEPSRSTAWDADLSELPYSSSRIADEIELLISENQDEEPTSLPFERSAGLYPYQNEISKTPLLSAQEEKTLGRAIQSGDEMALNELVRSNLRLVISIAKYYRDQGLEMEDLIQEGTVGLIQAAKKFNPTLGYRFSTYATWWIRQAVARAVANKGRAIRLPVHLRSSMQKVKRVCKYYHQHLGRYPTAEELKSCTGMPAEEIARLMESNLTLISLDDLAGSNERKTVEEYIQDTKHPSPEFLAEQAILQTAVGRITRLLTASELKAVSYFYGLSGVEMSTGEIAVRMNTSADEVRRMIRRSLKRLKRHLQTRHLSDFLG